MKQEHIIKVATDLKLTVLQVGAAAQLLSEGATVPFIARYRKEATGSLDEVQITSVRDMLENLKNLDDRRESIKKSLDERKLLTPELSDKLENATSLTILEDIYQPYKPKRRTKATIARENGLTDLATFIFENQDKDYSEIVGNFLNEKVATQEDALAGARDIIAEVVSDDASARASLREFYEDTSVLSSKVLTGKEEEGAKYRDYFDWSEISKKSPSHRILAIRRGEAEGVLMMKVNVEEELATNILKKIFLKGNSNNSKQVSLALEDSFKRLLSPTTQTHIRLELKKKADEEAVKIFANNLRELLMASPLGAKNILALDPGFRTGCKLVCLNKQGDLLHNDVIYPEHNEIRRKEASDKVLAYSARFGIEAIAIGNGTASRETESFVKSLNLNMPVIMVNESGASIYSASEVARDEFPDQDITVRGAVSIGRRLMDPLAELVKIDPQSIGVGQYQHDVNQVLLKNVLDDVVVSCVNNVGVELNTASKQLLSYVSGLNATTASNIVSYRNENGPFKSRKELNKVKGLGAKSFEQAAGFLRIMGAKNPLDFSAVHPERYGLVENMASDLNVEVDDLLKSAEHRNKIDLNKYVDDKVGLPTLKDILSELAKPGRDPRQEFEIFEFASQVHKIEDLQEGMRLPGIVTNVTAFGAFVDIGVHQDGLVHISELSDSFVKDANEVVKPQQKVNVYVMEVDKVRKRIGLSMKTNPQKKVKSAGQMAKDNQRGNQNRRSSFNGSSNSSFGNSLGDAFGAFGSKF